MAITYTLYERTVGNGNPQAVAVPNRANGSAGSLAIGIEFFYKVIANGYSDFYRDLNAWLSATSAEVSATTDASNRVIWVHFDNDVSGQEETTTIRSEISGDYNQTDSSGNVVVHFPRMTGYRSNHYYGVRTNNSSTYDRFEMAATGAIASLSPGEIITEQVSGATALVVTDPAGGSTFKVWTLTGTWDGLNPFDGSVSGVGVGTWSATSAKDGWVMEDYSSSAGAAFPVFHIGLPVLYHTGGVETTDPVTPMGYYDYLISVGKQAYIVGVPLFPTGDYVNSSGNDICNVFKYNFSHTGASTSFYYQPGGTVVSKALAKQMWYGPAQFGDLSVNGVTTNGCANVGCSHLAFYNTISYLSSQTTKIYGSMMGMVTALPGTQVNRDPYYQISGPIEIYDSIFRSSGRFRSPYIVRNSRMMLSGEVSPGTNNESDAEGANFNNGIATYYPLAEGMWNNFTLNKTNTTYDVFHDGFYTTNSTKTHRWNNSQFTDATYRSRIRGAAAGTDLVNLENYNADYKFVDENGNDVEDVEISVFNNFLNRAIVADAWSGATYSTLGKAGTAVVIWKGDITVGKYYQSGDEYVKVESGSYPNYIISRAQLGSTANNIGGGTTSKATYFFEVPASVLSDANGEATTRLNQRYWKSLDYTNTGTVYVLSSAFTERSPFYIVCKKAGYESIIIKKFTFKNSAKTAAAGRDIFERKKLEFEMKLSANTRRL